jgi:two-component system, OmpR family, sensor histidine kinase KdpD
VNEDSQTKQFQEPGKLEQRLLVAMTPSQSSEQLVHWAHQLAASLNCPWAVVYVETSASLPEEVRLQLSRALFLARTLGAEVITTTDPDFVRGLLRTALQRDVTQIIIARQSGTSNRRFFRKDKWLDRLLRESGEIHIHVVRFKDDSSVQFSPTQAPPYGSTLREYLIAVGTVLAATWGLFHIKPLIGYHGVAWVLLAIVVVMASFVGRGATLLAAIMSAVLWNFLFEEPIFSFYIAKVEDRVLFVMYLVIAVVLGQLTARIRRQERAERERHERAEALQILTREVTEATEFNDMLNRAMMQTMVVFKAQVALFLSSSPGRLSPHKSGTFQVPEEEDLIVAWVHEKGQTAGRFAVNFPQASALFLPLAVYGDKMGVIALRLSQSLPPTIHQRNLIDAFAEQIALAIQRHQMQEISQRSKVLAESERLSKTLLNSISHEIRTPLTAIQTATDYMTQFEKAAFSETQKGMIVEIQEATQRLNRLAGKVFEMTRLEFGQIKPKFEACEVSDLAQMAEGETRKELAQHTLTIQIAPDLPPVPMDFELMLHSVANLLSNAAFHTPTGTEVRLEAKAENGDLIITVADGGPGISPESIPHLFEKFYRAPNARAGGTGLGLSLVKGFVEAHGGRVTAENRATGGAEFTIHLPLTPGLATAVQTIPLAV